MKRDLGAERANRVRTELGYNDHMLEPLAVAAAATTTPAPTPPQSADKKSPIKTSDPFNLADDRKTEIA